MADQYGDDVAAIAYYTGDSDPYYTLEGDSRWFSYPPPYRMGGQWYYAWPWLWMDGDKHPGYLHETWEGYLQARLPVPSDLQIDLAGNYDPGSSSGSLEITVYNAGATACTGTLQCVLTESGLYYPAPNGLEWHHHVMRDLIPTDAGVPMTIAPGQTAVITHPFEIAEDWIAEECELVCFVQDNIMQADSTIAVWQGAKVTVAEITVPSGVPQIGDHGETSIACVLQPLRPNPVRPGTQLVFYLDRPAHVVLAIYDLAGRQRCTLLNGSRAPGRHVISWSGLGADGRALPSGKYYCRLDADDGEETFRRIQPLLISR